MDNSTESGTVYLVRHGRTALNVGNRFRGLEDVPLDEVGLAEVEETGERLKGAIDPARPPTQIFTSPMSRTRSTAAAVARHFDLEPVPDDRLLDLDYGQWTALTHEEAEALDAQAYGRSAKTPTTRVLRAGAAADGRRQDRPHPRSRSPPPSTEAAPCW